MGGLFSKSATNKVVPEPERSKPTSAPARLTGLDGTEDPIKSVTRRAITPTIEPVGTDQSSSNTQVSSSPTSPATAGTPTSPTKQRKKIDVIGAQTDGALLAKALPAAITIPEEAQPWAKVFDERSIRNLHSTDWKDREQGFKSVARAVANPKFQDVTAAFIAATQITAFGIKDKVAPLYHASLELLHEVLRTFCSQLPKEALHPGLDLIMPQLVHRCGNLNTRIHEAALQALMDVTSQPKLGTAYVGPYALAPLPKKAKDASLSAQMFGRLDLVHGLLSTYGMNGGCDGMGVSEVMAFAKKGLDMPDDKVRQSAIRVIVEVYRLRRTVGEVLEPEKYLGAVKPALLQVLQRRFEEATSNAGAASSHPADAAIATGVKVFAPPVKGQALPPLGSTSMKGNLPPIGSLKRINTDRAMTPAGSGANTPKAAGLEVSGRGLQGTPPMSPLAGPGGMSGRARTPMTPPKTAESGPGTPSRKGGLLSPSPLPPSPMGRTGSKNLRAGSNRYQPPASPTSLMPPSVLDDAEEQLIRYIAADNE